MRRLVAITILGVLLASCSETGESKSKTGSAATTTQAAASGEIAGKYDVGDYQLHLRCEGSGSPKVVYLHGLGGDGSDIESINAPLADRTRVCTYDRLHVGHSDSDPGRHTGADSVRDLHTLLQTDRILDTTLPATAVPRRATAGEARGTLPTLIALVGGGGLGTLPVMEVLVIGGHGKVGLRLLGLLARDGHRGRGVIRKAEQASDLSAAGAEAVLCDLERGEDLRPHVGAADAIVFAAGAGPGSGPERKRTVDYGAAVRSMEVASELEVSRFVIVSSIGTHDVASATEAMRPYLQAKRDADDALKRSGLDWTIVKPGHLTDAPGSGRVQVSRTFGGRADVPRDDVALVLLECLEAPNTIGVEFELFEGDAPAREAVRSL